VRQVGHLMADKLTRRAQCGQSFLSHERAKFLRAFENHKKLFATFLWSHQWRFLTVSGPSHRLPIMACSLIQNDITD
jgi:hypothetical protein